ncbi:MAG: hypothetical protein ABJO36_04725 [Litorimonas sp.]
MMRQLNLDEMEIVSGGSLVNPEEWGPYPVNPPGGPGGMTSGGPTGHPNGGVDGPTGDDAYTTLED